MPTDKVTSSVDYRLKMEYEMTFESGKAVYKDLIEEGMLKRIEEIDPIKACKMRIDRYKRLLDEEEAKLRNLELLEQMAKLEPKKQNKDEIEQSKLQNHREKMFMKYRRALEYQRENRQPHDWGKIQEDFKFKNKVEAMDYIDSMLETSTC